MDDNETNLAVILIIFIFGFGVGIMIGKSYMLKDITKICRNNKIYHIDMNTSMSCTVYNRE